MQTADRQYGQALHNIAFLERRPKERLAKILEYQLLQIVFTLHTCHAIFIQIVIIVHICHAPRSKDYDSREVRKRKICRWLK